MRRVAVIGVGVTKFGKHDRTSAELFAQAAADAILDAGIAPTAIQALYFGNVTGGETERQLHMAPLAATLLGLPTVPTTRFENACATSHVAFRHALMEIASGVSDVVLVGGAERVLNVPTESATEFFAYCSDASIEQPAGLTFPGVFALIARAHMDKYGTTEEQMAHVAVKNHHHGTLNPKAQFQKEISLETVLKSAYVADPLKLFDCCPFTDGGAALVLASEEVARKHRRPIWVLGSHAATDTMFVHEKRDLSRVTATERAAQGAYRQAGKTPADVNVVELHDCFTIAEIVATEGLGFFEPGTGGLAAEKGWTSLGGKLPVNPSGGLKAKGHPIGATGAAQIAEIVTQLRGEAGPRQVDGASTGLTHTLGGNTATVLVSLSAVTERVVHLKDFFAEARAGRLTGIRCGRCGALAIPPKEFCEQCQQREWQPVPLGGAGTIVSFTVIRVAPRGRSGEVPYAVAVVRLEEGVSILGRVVDVPFEALKAGLPVRFRPVEIAGQTMVGFGPA